MGERSMLNFKLVQHFFDEISRMEKEIYIEFVHATVKVLDQTALKNRLNCFAVNKIHELLTDQFFNSFQQVANT